mgnify:CR=1 FL=1
MNDDQPIGKLVLFIVSSIIGIWLLSLLLLHDLPDRGSFGDMFGAVNALFSGLAFAGVIIAILLQKNELSLQRKELELTRDELKGQRSEMVLQNKTLLKQSFENTFFQLLGLQQEIINSIDLVDGKGRVTKGRDCIQVFYKRLNNKYKALESLSDSDETERIKQAYIGFYGENQSEIGHYFRSLYHIIKLIDQSEVDNKRLYTNLVRAQLSSYELTLLFYNCISDLGHDKFKPLIEKYAFFKNLSESLLIRADHKGFYLPNAYE